MVSPNQDVLEGVFSAWTNSGPPMVGIVLHRQNGKFIFFMYGILRDADALELTLLLKGMKAALLDVSRMVCDF